MIKEKSELGPRYLNLQGWKMRETRFVIVNVLITSYQVISKNERRRISSLNDRSLLVQTSEKSIPLSVPATSVEPVD